MPIPLATRIAQLVPTMDGWCTVTKAQDLALAVIKSRSSVSLECGVFGGRSLLPMALAHAEQDHGVVWAIDPWSRDASIEGYDGANAAWWGNVDHEAIYQRFLAHLKTQGVEKYVKIIRAKSDDVEPPDVINVAHIDGQHTDQAVRDVERFCPRILVNGFCFIDDINWSNGGPKRAAEKLVTMNFRELFTRDTGAMFQRETPKVKKGGWPKGKSRK